METTFDESKAIPLHEGIFTWPPAKSHLIGSKCTGCGEIYFPRKGGCLNPVCPGGEMKDVELSNRGKLYSYVKMQYVPPAPFDKIHSEVPFGVGLVELSEGVIVVAKLTTCDPAELKVGRPMEMVIQKFYTDEAGKDVVSYKFKPI